MIYRLGYLLRHYLKISSTYTKRLNIQLAGFTAYSKNMGLVEGALGMATTAAAAESTMVAIIIYYTSSRMGMDRIHQYVLRRQVKK